MMTNCFFFYFFGWPTKSIYSYFQLGPLSKIITIMNFQHPASRIWTCAAPKFWVQTWMKLCCSDSHYTILVSTFIFQIKITNCDSFRFTIVWLSPRILGDSQNYMPPFIVPPSAKRITTQILVIAKLNERLLN